MLYTRVDLPSDEPVQFVGVYVTRWRCANEPTVAFREATREEIAAALRLTSADISGEIITEE